MQVLFFYEVSSVHNTIHSKYLIMPIHQAILAKLKRRGEKEEYEKNCEMIGHSPSKLI